MEKIYKMMMYIGYRSGCHQRADRSFFYKDRKFPICARCTGVIIGNLLAIPFYLLYGVNLLLCFIFASIMFFDWLIQYIKICESTNGRRLVTGILGGYSVMTIQITIVIKIVKLVF